MAFTKENARELGRRGGLATQDRHADKLPAWRKKGGEQLVKKHGTAHMKRIGRRGFHAFVARHFDGDRQAAIDRLVALGLIAQDPEPENGAWQRWWAILPADRERLLKYGYSWRGRP